MPKLASEEIILFVEGTKDPISVRLFRVIVDDVSQMGDTLLLLNYSLAESDGSVPVCSFPTKNNELCLLCVERQTVLLGELFTNMKHCT
jgi:hypothetical protein